MTRGARTHARACLAAAVAPRGALARALANPRAAAAPSRDTRPARDAAKTRARECSGAFARACARGPIRGRPRNSFRDRTRNPFLDDEDDDGPLAISPPKRRSVTVVREEPAMLTYVLRGGVRVTAVSDPLRPDPLAATRAELLVEHAEYGTSEAVPPTHLFAAEKRPGASRACSRRTAPCPRRVVHDGGHRSLRCQSSAVRAPGRTHAASTGATAPARRWFCWSTHTPHGMIPGSMCWPCRGQACNVLSILRINPQISCLFVVRDF
jgi:hypothetical protein